MPRHLTGRTVRTRSRMQETLRGSRGAALLLTVVLLFLLLAFLGTWILGGTFTFLSGVTVRSNSLQAYCLARSGLAWARREIAEKRDLDGDGKVGQIGSPDGNVRRPFDGGSFWVSAAAQGKNLTLTAFGSYQEITRKVRSTEESP
jgi:hypothetical protein